MYKIDSLNIKSFKFFKDVEPLKFNKQNILIYGENGSGKSTIFWALYTFFQSALKENDNEIKKYFIQSTEANPNKNSLVNIYENSDENAKIELTLKDINNLNSDKVFTISKESINTNKEDLLIEQGCYAGDFINYKYIFRFFDFLHTDEIDLFKLFEYEILHFITKDGQNLSDLWDEIVDIKNRNPGPIKDRDEFNKLTNKLVLFNRILTNKINQINQPSNDYLIKFNYENIKLKLRVINGKYTRQKKFIKPKIDFSISFKKDSQNDLAIHRSQSYFNEAKLTAIALSVRFALTKIKLQESDLKVLVLDDLLVSLDMSNRELVLDMLVNDDSFQNFQIIMLTHDKAFYEKSKRYFNFKQKNQWKYFEMYLDRNEEGIEKPYIKDCEEYNTYIDIAKQHFENKDYPASANYLRKEVEKRFDEFLELDSLDKKIFLSKLKENYSKIIEFGKDLESLKSILVQFQHCSRMPSDIQVEKCTLFANQISSAIDEFKEYQIHILDVDEFENLHFILKDILHPQSHNDLSRPLYKLELEKSIELVSEFSNLIDEAISGDFIE